MKEEKKPKKIKKKKLLIVTDNFLPRVDGIAIFLSKVIPLLIKKYEVTVVAPNFGKIETEDYKIVKIPLSKKTMGDYVSAKLKPKKIKQLVKKSDLVFSQTIGPIGFLGIWYAKSLKVPCISFMHSIEWELVPMAAKAGLFRKILYPFMKLMSSFIYNKSTLMLLPSDGILEKVSWQRIKTRKEIVNLGVDCNHFVPYNELKESDKKKVDKLRQELDLENVFVVGNHGRLAREKDLMTLLRSFKWLKKKHSDVKLLILGNGLEEIRTKLVSVQGVSVLSAKEDVNLYLSLMDVYVTSSITETTSLATLEAMASGLPVVSTPVGFIKEYIKDNVNGFLFPLKDEYSLYKKIDLLKNNKPLTRTIGERARKTVLNRFTWKNTVDSIEKAFESVEK